MDAPAAVTLIHLDDSISLTDALRAVDNETIIIADPEARLDPDYWNWISTERKKRAKSGPVPAQVFFGQNQNGSRWGRILLAIYHGLVRLLLKTNKSELKTGYVILSRTQAQPLILAHDQAVCFGGNRSGLTNSLSEFLAFARLHGLSIEETETRNEQGNSNRTISVAEIIRETSRSIQFWWNRIMFPVAVEKSFTRQPNTAAPQRLAAWAILLLGSVLILFSNLNYPLFEPDEARNAQLAMNVVSSSDWMSLTLAGEPYWDKPPGQIWAIATSYKIFGMSPWATRLPGALATATTMILMLLLGQRLVGFRAAFLGSMALLLSCGFMLIGRYVTMDASLTACVLLTSVSLILASQRKDRSSPSELAPPIEKLKTGWLLLAGVAAGLGFIVKGPVVLVLAIPPVIVAGWLAGQWPILRQRRNLMFFLPLFLIAGPWFIAMALIHPDFLTYFFWKHHVVRFSEAFNHREPFWYYLPAILIMMFPASYLLPSLIKFLTSRKPEARNLRTAGHGFLCLMSLWVVGFFSISESKLPTYILPALPPIGLLMGVLLDKKIFSFSENFGMHSLVQPNDSSRRPSFMESLPKRVPIGLLGICVAIITILTTFFQSPLPAPMGMLVIGGISVFIIAMIPWRSGTQPTIAWSCVAVLGFCLVTTSVNYLVPQISTERSIHAAAAELKRQPESQSAPIVFFAREDYGAQMLLPKSEIHNFKFNEMELMIKFLLKNPQAIIVSSDDEMEDLRKNLPWTIELERSETIRHLFFSSPRESNPPTRTARADEWESVR